MIELMKLFTWLLNGSHDRNAGYPMTWFKHVYVFHVSKKRVYTHALKQRVGSLIER